MRCARSPSQGNGETNPLLLMISGDPGSGKSSLARVCSAELEIPVVSRDLIKETMFDSLGWSDREWSRKVGAASYEVLFLMLGTMLRARASLILDCHFSSPPARSRLSELVSRYPHRVIEVICTATADVLFERFQSRAESGARHPGHADIDNLAEFRSRLGNHPLSPVVLGGDHLVVDTGSVSPDSAFLIVQERLAVD